MSKTFIHLVTGTLFQESWKRKHARLAYEWDVDTYHFSEPDRPEFYGTKERDVIILFSNSIIIFFTSCLYLFMPLKKVRFGSKAKAITLLIHVLYK